MALFAMALLLLHFMICHSNSNSTFRYGISSVKFNDTLCCCIVDPFRYHAHTTAEHQDCLKRAPFIQLVCTRYGRKNRYNGVVVTNCKDDFCALWFVSATCQFGMWMDRH